MKRIVPLLLAVIFAAAMLALGVTQEVPVGRLEGKIVMRENGRPLPDAAVTVSLIGAPEYERPKARGVETDEDGHFAVRNLPAGEYELRVSANLHSTKRRRVTIEEGKTARLDLEAEPNEPYLRLYDSQKVFTPDETPSVEIHGFVQAESVAIHVYRLGVAAVAAKGGLERVNAPFDSNEQVMGKWLRGIGKPYADLSHPISKRDAEGEFIEPLALGNLPEGFYFVDCSAAKERAHTLLIVSRIALVTKTEPKQALCYATDIVSGQPLPGVEIDRAVGRTFTPVGKTGPDGTLSLPILPKGDSTQVLVARNGPSVALVGFDRQDPSEKAFRTRVYCERPAYRPGDQVFFKGIVRRTMPEGYALPGPGDVTVNVKDPNGNVLETQKLALNGHGAFDGTFRVPAEGDPGIYNLDVRAFGVRGNGFANVVAYRKPEYSIEVRPAKPVYVMGDHAAAIVECKYYFGGPVVGAKVKASVYRTPAIQDEDEDTGMEQVSSAGGGEYSEDVEAITDANGQARIEFDTRGDNDPEVFTNDYLYKVYANVTEDGGKYFDGDGEVRVVRGDYDVQLNVENPIVAPGEVVGVVAKVTDPVDHKRPVAGRKVELAFGREEWTNDTSVFIQRGVFQGVSGPDGLARFNVGATKDGSLAFRAISHDDSGRTIVASGWSYVEGSPAMRAREEGSMTVVLDKRRYNPGDTARALLQTNYPGGSALVTVQADTILWRQVVPLNEASTLIRIPVPREAAPDAHVSVAYVRKKRFLEASKSFDVDRIDRDLKVEVVSDRQTYHPGDTATLTVRTTDAQGRPTPAEVSVGVVDEGIYAIHEDETDLKKGFYPDRGNNVQTAYSFPEAYLDGGDKGSSKIPLRKVFRDTAGWRPSLWTGPDGVATTTVELPDNLTQWRATAVGVSDATQAGMATTRFRARKELMVRLELPQYLVDGDQQRMTVVVSNDTGQDQDVNVAVGAQNVSLVGAGTKTIRVPSGKPQTLEYEIHTQGPATATLTARAWIAGGPSDGVQQSFPVEPHGRKVIATRAGEVNGSEAFTLPIGPTVDPNYGELKISFSPTLAGDLVRAADDLVGFPYGCVEQTMSRFLPSLLVERAVRQAGLPPPKRLAQVPRIVRDSLTRLRRMRHEDGAWGWWEYDASDPFMTALVLDGLSRARDAGYDIRSVRLDDALTWSENRLKKPEKGDRLRDRLYLAYGLLRFGRKDVVPLLEGMDLERGMPADRGPDPKNPRTGPSVGELATAVLAYHEAGLAGPEHDALERIRVRAQGSEGLAYWPSEENAWGEEPTALALVAFETSAPGDPIVPKIVRSLMRRRRGDSWVSTRDSAYALIGLTSYLARTKELTSGLHSVTVTVNGQDQDDMLLDPTDLDSPRHTIRVLRPRLGNGEVKIEMIGDGTVYYTAELTTLDTAPELRPMSTDPSLRITRNYYALEARPLENGTQRLLPSKQPVTSFHNGDLIRVELTIDSDFPRSFVMIEEPTPSSARIQEREEFERYEEWGYWYSDRVIRDDRIAFFARWLPKGTSKITYTMRAEQPGTVRALPTIVQNMYDPALRASTGDQRLQVGK